MHFDHIIDRTAQHAFKWLKYKDQDIIPMWVADMDFKCAAPIVDAVTELAQQGIYGYVHPNDYPQAKVAIQHWLSQQHQWDVDLDWIVWTPGVVPAFNIACQAYCEAGDKVIVQTPNYPPMRAAPNLNHLQRLELGAKLTKSEISGEQRYTLDFEALETFAADPKCKLFILCNPMNPMGSVLTEEELNRVVSICNQHDVVLCSDEIHCDLVLDETAKHIPASSIEAIKDRSLTLMAASKTFNIAGLATSFAIIPDATIRQRFVSQSTGISPWVTIMGMVATEKAFTECDQWYQSMLAYIRGNRDYLFRQINRLPGLKMLRPQATYLAWVDATGLGVDSPQKHYEEKGIGFSPGVDFGNKNYVRINYGCPRSYIDEALIRMSK